jgi:cephalosporin-C deacetylase-like acetyl esterase
MPLLAAHSRVLAAVLALAGFAAASTAVDPLLLPAGAPEPTSAVLSTGETGTLRFALPEGTQEARYRVLEFGARERSRGVLIPGADGAAAVEVTLPHPGSVLVTVDGRGHDGVPFKARGGMLFSPERIAPASARPEDFDSFWDGHLAALDAVPLDTRLEPAPGAPDGVEFHHFSVSVGTPGRAHGQLAARAEGGRLPALVIFQWAGVYPLQSSWVLGRASQGWLTVNVLPHDLPMATPAAEFEALKTGRLRDYGALGAEDRNASYFLRMFLATRRVLDFVRAHPRWDGRTLVVMGTSQGGTQAIVAAALDPAVTAALANVPALCDQDGADGARAIPFPYWIKKTEGRDPAAVRGAARYFDVAHFAPRVRAPVLVSAGLVDETCPPAGISAMANALAGPREILFLARSDHQGRDGTQKPFTDRSEHWLGQLRTTGSPPPAP